MPSVLLVRGGGDLATGAAWRLYQAGIPVLITEIDAPLAVRRRVSFSEAVYEGLAAVEGVQARRIEGPEEVLETLETGSIPVLVDPVMEGVKNQHIFDIAALVDARMAKRLDAGRPELAGFIVGLGPGFHPGRNCDAVVETMRGHTLGRVYWDRPAEPDTGIPEGDPARVLRAPASGYLVPQARIGDRLLGGQVIAHIRQDLDQPEEAVPRHLRILSPFAGVLRGLIRPGIRLQKGVKVGDVDPRGNPSYTRLISDKALAVGGGVVEAVLSKPEVRSRLWKF